MTRLVMVYIADIAPLKGVIIIAVVLEALKKSVVAVVVKLGKLGKSSLRGLLTG